jgi:hypothetical protein
VGHSGCGLLVQLVIRVPGKLRRRNFPDLVKRETSGRRNDTLEL